MRALVCGGRDFDDRNFIYGVLDRAHAEEFISVVIHGDAPGADTFAAEWADDRGIPVKAFPADWQRYGQNAGRLRNAKMLREAKPTIVIAFPGGRGTAHMVSIAKAEGVRVAEIGDV